MLYLFYAELIFIYTWKYFMQRNLSLFPYSDTIIMFLFCAMNFIFFIVNFRKISPESVIHIYRDDEKNQVKDKTEKNNQTSDQEIKQLIEPTDNKIKTPISIIWHKTPNLYVKLFFLVNLITFIITLLFGYFWSIFFDSTGLWINNIHFPIENSTVYQISWTKFWYIELGIQFISFLLVVWYKVQKLLKTPDTELIKILNSKDLPQETIKNLLRKN